MGKKIIITIIMSSTTIVQPVRKRDKVLTQNTNIEKTRIRFIVQDYDNNKVDSRPDYQRDLRWEIERHNRLILTIMTCGYIPVIVLYSLQNDDNKKLPSHIYECIDGQHRLNTIIHYQKSEPIQIKNKDCMITWYHSDSDTYVFYYENENTKRWENENLDKKVGYMSEEERKDFDEYRIPIEQISCKLSYDNRCKLFESLQQGIQVRNSDLFKNKIEIPLISYIHKDMRFEAIYHKSITSRLTSTTKQNWLFCVVRMFMIVIDGQSNIDIWVETTDTEIKRKLNYKVPKIMNITKEQLQIANESVNRFIILLDSLGGIKFTPIQLLALYVYIQRYGVADESKLKTRLSNGWAGEGTKEKKRMWYQNVYIDKDTTIGISRQMQYYNESLEYLKSDSIITEPLNVGKRKTFGKKKRKQLWSREFGVSTVGECHTCKKKINKDEKWHAGHIVSHAKGGSDVDIKNFVVQCCDCNLRCGTKNVFEYERQNYIL
jgi:hypothetical protein